MATTHRGVGDRVGLDWYKLTSTFLVCGFLGWLFETLVVWRDQGRLTERGYLFVLDPLAHYLPFLTDTSAGNRSVMLGLPIIEIYGLGGIAILTLLHNRRHQPVQVFLVGFVLLTLLELLGSYLCSHLLHRTFWDYSRDFLNFQGRICLRSSLAWGVLTLVSVELVAPVIDRLHAFEGSRRWLRVVVNALLVCAVGSALLKYWWAPELFPSA